MWLLEHMQCSARNSQKSPLSKLIPQENYPLYVYNIDKIQKIREKIGPSKITRYNYGSYNYKNIN